MELTASQKIALEVLASSFLKTNFIGLAGHCFLIIIFIIVILMI